MGQKKDTLLRWVNCCSGENSVEKIKYLSDGNFFLYILDYMKVEGDPEASPWLPSWILQVHQILQVPEHKIDDDIIDLNAIAGGNEDELSKLIVVCMYLTMVKRPCETIKEKTIETLSMEDQKVIEVILHALVHDDRVTKSRLSEVLQDPLQLQEPCTARASITFYTSSPLSSMGKNSPLKRFLDSPMAMRLSRLQKEIHDKNEEIRRLQSEIITESDESTFLRQQMDELQRRMRQLEKNNGELKQRLQECQTPEDGALNADAEISKLRKQLKKLQSECETTSQKYCDLNIEFEALRAQRDKDRRLVKQLQADLNEATARFERESAEFQLLLDSIRTENMELKHSLEEKVQWIDVLEENRRTCTEMHSRFNAPRSPCERESIGFSLLSIETEKLQQELDAHQQEISAQAKKFELEKKLFQQRVDSLVQENSGLLHKVEESSAMNQSLVGQMEMAKHQLQQLTEGCNLLRQEKEHLHVSFGALQTQFQDHVESAQQQLNERANEALELNARIEILNEQLAAESKLKNDLERSLEALSAEKADLNEKLAAMEQAYADFRAHSSAADVQFHRELDDLSSQLGAKLAEIAAQSEAIAAQEREIQNVREQLANAEEKAKQLEEERDGSLHKKSMLEQELVQLKASFEEAREELLVQLSSANEKLESSTIRISELCNDVASVQSELEAALQSKAELQTENDSLLADLDGKQRFISELEQEARRLQDSQQHQADEFENRTKKLLEEQAEHSRLLTEQLEASNALAVELREKYAKLKDEREALQSEKTTLEKMYLESKSAYETAESKMQMENEMVRQQIELKESELTQLSESLQRLEVAIEVIVQEKESAVSAQAEQLQSLEGERDELLHQRSLLAEEKTKLATSLEASKDEAKIQLAAMERQLAEQAQVLQQTEEQRSVLAAEAGQLQAQGEAALEEKRRLEDQLVALRDDWEVKRKQLEEERDSLRAVQASLENTNESVRNLESQTERLTRENRDLSLEKSNLEQLAVQLKDNAEAVRAAHENETTHLRQEMESKSSQVSALRAKVEEVGALLTESERGHVALKERIAELESQNGILNEDVAAARAAELQLAEELATTQQLLESLRSSSSETSQTVANITQQLLERETDLKRITEELDEQRKTSAEKEAHLNAAIAEQTGSNANTRREWEASVDALRAELQAEQSKVTQLTDTVRDLTAAKTEVVQLYDSLQTQLERVEGDKQSLVSAETALKQELTSLEEKLATVQEHLEKEKADHEQSLDAKNSLLQETADQLAQLSRQLEAAAALNVKLEADQALAHQEKIRLEQQCRDVQSSLQTSEVHLQKQLEASEAALGSKTREAAELSTIVTSLTEQLQQVTEQKRTLELEVAEKVAALDSEKKTLSAKEQELQKLRSDLEAEKENFEQAKGEIALEHRKEKAALEARLAMANSQVKSMQEKLVDMTVANQSQAPLEHKVTTLTAELEAMTKAKVDLEKRLVEATERKEEPMERSKPVKVLGSDCEIVLLRKKYDTAKKTISSKEDVINQYAAKFEKMQQQLDSHGSEVESLKNEVRRLTIENRTLKTEQKHLLAQIAAEKDKAALRTSRHNLALQRGAAGSDGGTLADAALDNRRRTLRPFRSEVATGSRQFADDGFKAPQLAFGDGSDGNSVFKVPPSRRESTSSVCSNRSGINVPQGAGRLFTCDDEDGEQFSSSYLNELKEGHCKVDNMSRRMSELHRRNTLQPPHMRSAYPTEANDERLRKVESIPDDEMPGPSHSSSRMCLHDETVNQLSVATSELSMSTPPAMNTRKRRSSSWNQSSMETPVIQTRKRRSFELDLSVDSAENYSIASAERKKRRDSSQTNYKRPGPPTPSKNSLKENVSSSSLSSATSPPKVTPKPSTRPGSRRTSPSTANKSVKLTPATLVKKVQSSLKSKKQSGSEQNTPNTTPRSRSKLNIFRKPLGSRGYNSETAKF